MLKYFIFTIVVAIITALWEIQIEGGDGWAKKLPTFRINVFFRKLLGNKPLTGYHIFLLLLFITVFHGIFINELGEWRVECKVFGLVSWFFVIEDVLWFMFNPHYRLKNFCKGKIEWHNRWVWCLPLTYWWGMIIGTTLLLLGNIKCLK
jgi:hypothetical protein